jgi:hypothetical protein
MPTRSVLDLGAFAALRPSFDDVVARIGSSDRDAAVDADDLLDRVSVASEIADALEDEWSPGSKSRRPDWHQGTSEAKQSIFAILARLLSGLDVRVLSAIAV